MYLDEIDIKATKKEMIRQLKELSYYKREELMDYIFNTDSMVSIFGENKVLASMDRKCLGKLDEKDCRALEAYILFTGIDNMESPFKEILSDKYILKKTAKETCDELKIGERTYWRNLDKAYFCLALRLDMEILIEESHQKKEGD